MTLPERILHVNLTDRVARVESRPALFREYIGGVGAASKLLLEECEPRISPFSPNAPIILATGPLVGLFPCMSKAVALFKSPLTGNLGESYAGGTLSLAMRSANYGAIVIKGASQVPVKLTIGDDYTRIDRADDLWGLSPLEVDARIRTDDNHQSVTSIGRAGENEIYYSGAIVDRYHCFGRLGLGAVMGSKKLKSTHLIGSRATTDPNSTYDEVLHLVAESPIMRKYREIGTTANVLALNALHSLPTKNFSKSTYEKAEMISGEKFVDSILRRRTSCAGCPVACAHLGAIQKSQSHESNENDESALVPYNYEPVFALGSNLDISNPKDIMHLISCCTVLGLDAMMAGTVLAWLTEAYEKQLIGSDETLGVIPAWGDTESYAEILERIVNPPNRFYTSLACGVAYAAEEYGGKEFAISIGRNSLSGYLTGYGAVVGPLVGARHSHLSNSGYLLDQISMIKSASVREIAEFLIREEDWINVINSLIACYFSRDIYECTLVLRALRAAGMEQTETGLMSLGKKIFHNLYTFKVREGFELTKQSIPDRLLKTETPIGCLKKETIDQIISAYVKLRRDEGTNVSVIEEDEKHVSVLSDKSPRRAQDRVEYSHYKMS